MEKLCLVIAPSLRFFLDEMQERALGIGGAMIKSSGEALIGDTRYRFISRPEQLRGFHGIEVEFLGNMAGREDYLEFVREAEWARMP